MIVFNFGSSVKITVEADSKDEAEVCLALCFGESFVRRFFENVSFIEKL